MTKERFESWDKTYLDIAQSIANMSHAKRRQVGSIIVKDNSIISYGYNGMPKGMDNCCEIDDKSKDEVLHAEANAIMKVAKSSMSTEDATLYITLSPCMSCAKLILQSGIKRIVFSNYYREISGIDFLRNSGIEVADYLAKKD